MAHFRDDRADHRLRSRLVAPSRSHGLARDRRVLADGLHVLLHGRRPVVRASVRGAGACDHRADDCRLSLVRARAPALHGTRRRRWHDAVRRPHAAGLTHGRAQRGDPSVGTAADHGGADRARSRRAGPRLRATEETDGSHRRKSRRAHLSARKGRVHRRGEALRRPPAADDRDGHERGAQGLRETRGVSQERDRRLKPSASRDVTRPLDRASLNGDGYRINSAHGAVRPTGGRSRPTPLQGSALVTGAVI